MWRLGVILAVSFLLTIAVASNSASPPSLSALSFNSTTWTTEQGLPGDTVRAITQTRDGYLWVATQAGLARFDGVKFTVFSKPSVPEFRTNECNALLEARDGTLWIGTIGGGLMRYRDGLFTTFGRAEGLATDVINGLFEDRDGRLWITSYELLTVFENGQFHSYKTADADQHVYAIPFFHDQAGRVWIFNTRGFGLNNIGSYLYFQDGQLHAGKDAADGPLFSDAVTPFVGRSGAAWITDRTSRTVTQLSSSGRVGPPITYAMNEAFSLAHEDAAGELWLLTGSGELRQAGLGGVKRVAAAALPSAPINLLYADREGNLWLGSSAGLTRLKRLGFRSYTTAEGLSNETVWTILEDSRGDMWVGTNGGVDRIRGESITTFGVADGMAASGAVSIAEDRSGRVWFASTRGLTSLSEGKFRKYGRAEGLLNENVRSVYVDHLDRLWVGSIGGLQLYDGVKFTNFTTVQGLSDNQVLFVYEDGERDLWIGTPNGLNRMRGDRFEVFRNTPGLTSNIVVAARQTSDGTLWFGTVGGGLVRFRNDKFVPITTVNGLGDDTITTVLDDEQGNLWLGSTRGVFRLSRTELDEFADGKRRTVTSVAYTKADGLPSSDCSGGTQPAGWRSRDGRLWFPTAKGVGVIDPRGLVRNLMPPPVVIEGLTVDRENKPIGENVSLDAGSRAVEFHYTALSFRDPSKVRFRYRLEGFDPDWIEAGTRREAFYTNLRPGHYRFRVIAANDDGVWNEQGASFSFVLRPYFYQTIWFYLLCAIFLAAAMWGVHLLRVRQLRREFSAVLQERNRIARDLHDTLAQGFTSVSMLLEAVRAKSRNAPEAALEHLDQARLLVRSSLAEARRAVRDLRSEMLVEGDLAAALEKIARQLTAGTNVQTEISITGTPQRVGETVEVTLLRVGQEALTNAIRHANPTSLRCRLEYRAHQVRLCVSDDGGGFIVGQDTKETSNGFGLAGMRERIDALGGQLSIESQIGTGTEVCATVPVKGN